MGLTALELVFVPGTFPLARGGGQFVVRLVEVTLGGYDGYVHDCATDASLYHYDKLGATESSLLDEGVQTRECAASLPTLSLLARLARGARIPPLSAISHT